MADTSSPPNGYRSWPQVLPLPPTSAMLASQPPLAVGLNRPERSREENKERAYIAAARRKDRNLKARLRSARRAAEIHQARTGKALHFREDEVEGLEFREEDEEDFSPRSGTSHKLFPTELRQAPYGLFPPDYSMASSSRTQQAEAPSSESNDIQPAYAPHVRSFSHGNLLDATSTSDLGNASPVGLNLNGLAVHQGLSRQQSLPCGRAAPLTIFQRRAMSIMRRARSSPALHEKSNSDIGHVSSHGGSLSANPAFDHIAGNEERFRIGQVSRKCVPRVPSIPPGFQYGSVKSNEHIASETAYRRSSSNSCLASSSPLPEALQGELQTSRGPRHVGWGGSSSGSDTRALCPKTARQDAFATNVSASTSSALSEHLSPWMINFETYEHRPMELVGSTNVRVEASDTQRYDSRMPSVTEEKEVPKLSGFVEHGFNFEFNQDQGSSFLDADVTVPCAMHIGIGTAL